MPRLLASPMLALVLASLLGLGACSTSASGPSAAGLPDSRPTPADADARSPDLVPGQPSGPFDVSATRILRGDGTQAGWEELVAAAAEAQVVLLGEVHDDTAGHRLRARLLRDLAEVTSDPLILSMEMFERDVQPVLDEYLEGWITEGQFRAASRPWPNYDADYAPMVEWARAAGHRVVAANPPRRWVNRVTRLGPDALDSVPHHVRDWLPPVPWAEASEAYRSQWNDQMAEMAGAHGHGHGDAGPDPEHILAAQTLWDAGMAHSIVRELDRHPDARVVHLVGAFHVEWGTGIPEHLERYRPGTDPLVVVAYPEETDLDRFKTRGDFILLTPGG